MGVPIDPEWIQHTPDDMIGMQISDLLVNAGRFGREYKSLITKLYTEDVMIDPAVVEQMERTSHAYCVAIKARKRDVYRELFRLNVPHVNIEAAPLLAAALYETRFTEGECS